MKVAIIHDCLVQYGGAERVLQEILSLFPQAALFTLMNFLPTSYGFQRAKPSFLQKIPCAKKIYRYLLPLMPYAIEDFKLSSYDLIISSSYAVAKGILTEPHQIHICYCHTPLRLLWDREGNHLKERPLINFFSKGIVHRLRSWDVISSQRVDYFLANSQYIKKRIEKIYRREAEVIYPPVDVHRFSPHREKSDFYLTCCRLVSYKKVDMIVSAFSQCPARRLVVIGEGPERGKISALIKKQRLKNVTLLASAQDEEVKNYMERAKGFICAAKEDFGIVSVEAQSAGTGVIAFGQGGSLETVKGLEQDFPTGCFFNEQNEKSLLYALNQYEENLPRITREHCREHAVKFSKERFRRELSSYINNKVMHHESCSVSWR